MQSKMWFGITYEVALCGPDFKRIFFYSLAIICNSDLLVYKNHSLVYKWVKDLAFFKTSCIFQIR